MNTRRDFLKRGAGLILTPTLLSALRPARAGTTPTASEVAGRYLGARRDGRLAEAYALLAAEEAALPFARFKGGIAPPTALAIIETTSPVDAVYALFWDTADRLGFDFPAAGPGRFPETASVEARTPAGRGLTLEIVVSPYDHQISVFNSLVNAATPAALRASRIPEARALADKFVSLSHLKQIGLGLTMYVQEHGRFPHAATWMDDVFPYVRSEPVFQSPGGPAWAYAFNRNLSDTPLASLAAPWATVLAFESTLGTKNATDVGASVPRPGRHGGRTCFLFADGHVRAFADAANPSFLLTDK